MLGYLAESRSQEIAALEASWWADHTHTQASHPPVRIWYWAPASPQSVKDSIRVAPPTGWVLTRARLRESQVGRLAGHTQDPTEIRQMLPLDHRDHISVGEGGVSRSALLRVQKEPEGPGAWVAMVPGLYDSASFL